MKNIVYGAGGHAKVIVEILEDSNVEFEIYDFIKSKELLFNYKISDDTNIFQNNKIIIAIGDNKLRKSIAENLNNQFFNAIHKSANLSKRAIIGEGNTIMAGVSINSSTTIQNHCIINTNASIDHDCYIDNYVHISPNAVLCGNVTIGEGTHIGAGATIIPNIKIGKWCIIGAGAVVSKSLPDNCTAVGIPAKPIKFHN